RATGAFAARSAPATRLLSYAREKCRTPAKGVRDRVRFLGRDGWSAVAAAVEAGGLVGAAGPEGGQGVAVAEGVGLHLQHGFPARVAPELLGPLEPAVQLLDR